MILFGWDKVFEKKLGEYSENWCGLCNKDDRYVLMRKRAWFTLFFIPVICYRTEYFRRCIACGAFTQMDKHDAYRVMEYHFPSVRTRMRMGNMLRYVALAAFAVGILALALQSSDDGISVASNNITPKKIKALVPWEDGWYQVFDKEGQLIAEVTVGNDNKKLDTYYETAPYIEEDIHIAHSFRERGQYYEREKNEYVYKEDESAVVIDEYDVGVKYFWYDTFEDTMYWNFGVADLNDITYKEGYAYYVYTNYLENDDFDYYTRVLQKNPRYEVIMTFYNGSNQYDFLELVRLDVYEYANGMAQHFKESAYQRDLDITSESTIDEIIAYLKENEIVADTVYQYTYLADTPIVEKVSVTYWDAETSKNVINAYTYDVSERGGYYISKFVQ